MRDFFRCRIPTVDRILLVESGSRAVVEKLLPVLYRCFGPSLHIDLVTCYSGLPEGLAACAAVSASPTPDDPGQPVLIPNPPRVFRVSAYPGRSGRKRLYAELRRLRYPVLGIVCAGDPIMSKWKWVLAARIPAKVFIANENGDFFWFDHSNWRTLRQLALHRSGLAGPGTLRTAARIALFPFTLAFLLLYAAAAHCRRGLNLLFRNS
jgi:hypothetical protein